MNDLMLAIGSLPAGFWIMVAAILLVAFVIKRYLTRDNRKRMPRGSIQDRDYRDFFFTFGALTGAPVNSLAQVEDWAKRMMKEKEEAQKKASDADIYKRQNTVLLEIRDRFLRATGDLVGQPFTDVSAAIIELDKLTALGIAEKGRLMAIIKIDAVRNALRSKKTIIDADIIQMIVNALAMNDVTVTMLTRQRDDANIEIRELKAKITGFEEADKVYFENSIDMRKQAAELIKLDGDIRKMTAEDKVSKASLDQLEKAHAQLFTLAELMLNRSNANRNRKEEGGKESGNQRQPKKSTEPAKSTKPEAEPAKPDTADTAPVDADEDETV